MEVLYKNDDSRFSELEKNVVLPTFQRKLVWAPKHKESFIDTILRGFPFPEIYIAQSGIDLETFQSQQVVVDGQQRLSAIISYVSDELPCRNIPHYSDLNNQQKADYCPHNSFSDFILFLLFLLALVTRRAR